MLNFNYNLLIMKVAIIVPVLMGAVFSAAAQTQPLLQIVKEKKQPKKATPPFNYLNKGAAQPQAKLVAVTGAGKIYALPLDNMPCLVPNSRSSIPMPAPKQLPLQNAMPNALVLQPVIPQQ
jgi:hypothetical protein